MPTQQRIGQCEKALLHTHTVHWVYILLFCFVSTEADATRWSQTPKMLRQHHHLQHTTIAPLPRSCPTPFRTVLHPLPHPLAHPSLAPLKRCLWRSQLSLSTTYIRWRSSQKSASLPWNWLTGRYSTSTSSATAWACYVCQSHYRLYVVQARKCWEMCANVMNHTTPTHLQYVHIHTYVCTHPLINAPPTYYITTRYTMLDTTLVYLIFSGYARSDGRQWKETIQWSEGGDVSGERWQWVCVQGQIPGPGVCCEEGEKALHCGVTTRSTVCVCVCVCARVCVCVRACKDLPLNAKGKRGLEKRSGKEVWLDTSKEVFIISKRAHPVFMKCTGDLSFFASVVLVVSSDISKSVT